MKVALIIGLLSVCIRVSAQSEDFPELQKYSVQDIHTRFPFDQVKKIILVSYGVDASKGDKDNLGDEPKRFPLKGEQIAFDEMDDVVAIPKEKIDTVADILFNTCYRWRETEYTPAMCFLPRNAIIFTDVNGKAICYIEVCFECNRMRPSDKRVEIEKEICDNTLDKLESFFLKSGLRTGIKKVKK
ncbi:MAG: hypothetical protein QM762_13785 [Chryseolinea sp.]